MEDRSSSGKRQSTSIRVTPSKPDSKRERVEVAGGERGTRVKKSLLFGSTSGCKSSEKIQSPKGKVILFDCVCFCGSKLRSPPTFSYIKLLFYFVCLQVSNKLELELVFFF